MSVHPFSRIIGLVILLTIYTGSANAQWVETNSPATSIVHCFMALGPHLFAGTENGLFLSNDSGQNWTLVFNNGFPNGRVNSLAASDSNLFAGTDVGVAVSSDSGRTWFSPANELFSIHILAVAVSGKNIFAGSIDSGAYRSTDNGINWTPINNGLLTRDVKAFLIIDTNVFAINNPVNAGNATIYLLANSGAKWIKTNLPDSCIAFTFAASGKNIIAGTYKGIFISTDNGASWKPSNTGLTNTLIISLAIDGTNFFAATYGGGVFLSTNSGTNWTNVSEGLIDSTINALLISGSNIFAGSYDFSGGIFRRPLSEMINSNSVPRGSLSSFTLKQNSPNPFSTTSILHYSIPHHEHVQITLSNMLGEKLRTLFDEDPDEGEHLLTINSHDLPSGMYIVTAYAGGEILSEKISIEK